MKPLTNTENNEMIDIAGRIRGYRHQRRWTLEKLSEASGLSVSALSKIENNQVSTSFDALIKIATGFGLPLVDLVSETKPVDAQPIEPKQMISARRTYTRAGDGQHFASEYYSYELHSSDLISKGMLPLIMTIHTKEVPPQNEWSIHEGEEFIYVIKGEIIFHTTLYSPLQLRAGDSAYIDSTMGHAFVSVGEEDAVMASICMTKSLNFGDLSVGNIVRAK